MRRGRRWSVALASLGLIGVGVGIGLLARAAMNVPTGIAYSGLLKNNGVAENAPHFFFFELLDGTGTPTPCSDMRAALPVSAGRFDVPDLFKGCANLDKLFASTSGLAVRISVDGQVLSPTQPLGTVPFAARARVAETAEVATTVAPFAGAGASPTAPSPSCKTIKMAQPTAPSGLYYLQPASASNPFPAYCNMDDDGGGWTLFYAGRNGRARTLFTSLGGTVNADCPDPHFDCVRRLAADRTSSNTLIAASCGGAMIKFTPDAVAVQLFRDGTNPGGGQYYQPISAVSTIYGTVAPLPDKLYTGTQSQGWFLMDSTQGKIFSSGYPPPGYEGCNNVTDVGAQATLYWREM